MRFAQWLWADIKRLFCRTSAVLAALVLPLLCLLLFGAVAAPLLQTGAGLSIPYAVCDEDGSETVKQFVKLMVNSESLRAIATAYPVPDLQVAYELLNSGQVAVIVHIPQGFFTSIEAGDPASVSLIAYPEQYFAQTMVGLTLNGVLSVVGQGQNVLQHISVAAMEAGAQEGDAAALYDLQLNLGIENYMNRQSVLGRKGTLSLIKEYIPVKYYLSALFAFFCALACLPIIHLTAGDLSGRAVFRGLLASPGAAMRYFFARLCSGALLMLLMLLLLLPVSGLIQGLGVRWEQMAQGSTAIPALLFGMLVASFTFSALALLLGSLIKQPSLALWCAFYLVILMAFLSGGFINESQMEPFLLELGYYTPFKPTMNIIASALLSSDAGNYMHNIARLAILFAVFTGAGCLLVRKRGGSL